MLALVNELLIRKGDTEKKKSLLAPLVANPFTQPNAIGDFEQIFPFNQEVEDLSRRLCDPQVEGCSFGFNFFRSFFFFWFAFYSFGIGFSLFVCDFISCIYRIGEGPRRMPGKDYRAVR
jgi:hypothetical protein